MSNLVEYAKRELELAGLFDKDSDYGGALGKAVTELVEVFSRQGYSGASATMTLNLFNRVARFKPILPLTFRDDEWVEYAKDKYQNVRNSAVFKEGKDGRPYYIYAYRKIATFSDGHKSSWNGVINLLDGKYIGRCYIKDPRNMPTIDFEIPIKEEDDDWDFLPISIEDKCLDELKKYYDLELKE